MLNFSKRRAQSKKNAKKVYSGEQKNSELKEGVLEARKRHKRQKLMTALMFFLFGFIFILVPIVIEETVIKELTQDAKSPKLYIEIGIRLLSHLGIGCIIYCMVNIMLDMDHWTDYFKSRLTEIVRDKTYLKSYSREQLIDLQTDVLRTYFDHSELGGNDSFLKHYQKNIQEMIATPFRANVENEIFIEYTDDTKEEILIHEEISWICKSNMNVLQDSIKWVPGEGEFKQVNVICVKLQHDALQEVIGIKEQVIPFDNFEASWITSNQGFCIPLKDYHQVDGLKITLVIDLITPTQKFYAWRMAQITKGLSISVRFRKDLEVKHEIYTLDDNYFTISNNRPGFFKWSSLEWILPNEGIAFQLMPRNLMPTIVPNVELKPPANAMKNAGDA